MPRQYRETNYLVRPPGGQQFPKWRHEHNSASADEALLAYVRGLRSPPKVTDAEIRQRRADKTAAERRKPVQTFANNFNERDPTPGRVLFQWVTNTGPKTYKLGPSSGFSQDYGSSPGVQQHVRRAMADWSARDGGRRQGEYGRYASIADGSRFENYSAKFGPTEYVADLSTWNRPSHIVGSARLSGKRRGDRIRWRADNTMGLHSFGAGRYLDMMGLPSLKNRPEGQPFSNKTFEIEFETDLAGNHLRKNPDRR